MITAERDAELNRWRDALLWTRHADQGAAFRLAPNAAGIDAAVAAALAKPPTNEERGGAAFDGYPRDPEHPGWGYWTWGEYLDFRYELGDRD